MTNELLFTTRSPVKMMMSFGFRQMGSLLGSIFNYGSDVEGNYGSGDPFSTEPPFWPVQPWLGPLCEVPQEGVPCNLGDGLSVEVYPAPHPNGASLLHMQIGQKRICIMFDCEKPDALPHEVVYHCDFLVYDGMYENENYPEHVGWGHSTWQEGCRLAASVLPGQLIITHHDPVNTDEVQTDHTVIGDTVNMASHLVSCAPAGKVLISHSVANAVGKKAKTAHPKLPVRMKLKRHGFRFYCLNHLD